MARDLLQSIRQGVQNVKFSDLCKLVEQVGYDLARQRGSHRIYCHPRVDVPLVNLQVGTAGKAKAYQVAQVLKLVDLYKLEVK